MFLYGQHSRGGVKVYSDKLPSLLTAEASYQLWLEIKTASTEEMINQLIEGNMRIAAAIASRYAVQLKWIKYDLYCEAMLGLTLAVNKIHECQFKEPGALRGYLRKSIHGTIGKYISNCINGFSIDTKQITRIKKGRDKQFANLDELTRLHQDDGEAIKIQEEAGKEHLIDRMERLMQDAGLTEVEYKILTYYLINATEEETGKALGMSKSNVHYHKNNAIEKLKYIFFDESVDL